MNHIITKQIEIERRTKMEQQEKNEKLLKKHKDNKTEYTVSYGQKLAVILYGRMKKLIAHKCATPSKRDAFIHNYLLPNQRQLAEEKASKIEKHLRSRDLCDEIAQTVSMNIAGSLSKGLTKNNIMAGAAKDILFILRAPFDDSREDLRNAIVGFIDSIITNAGLGREYKLEKGEWVVSVEEEEASRKIYEFTQENRREYTLTLEGAWLEVIKRATQSYIRPVSNYPIMICKPIPHSNLVGGEGGYLEINSPLMKFPVRDTMGVVHPSILDFNIENNPEWFNAINRAQETAYSVNQKLLDVLDYFHGTDRSFSDYPYSLNDEAEEEKRMEAYVKAATEKEVDERNNARKRYAERFETPYEPLKASTVSQAERKHRAIYASKMGKAEGIIVQAREYKEFENLYFPGSVDYRGRRYPYANTGLSYQGGEMAKALLQFADKKVLDKKGLRALFECLGNCIKVDGVDKLDKKVRRIKANVAKDWFITHKEEFLKGNFEMFIDEQDKFEEPINALAIVMELVEYAKAPKTYKSGYVLHQDARCSGGAIIGTSLGDEMVMKMTSIIDYADDSEYLGDLYGMVADAALGICVELAADGNEIHTALLASQDILFTRKMFKDPVMTKSNYGATDYRVRKQTEGGIDWEAEGFTFEHKQAFDRIVLDALASALPSCTSFLEKATGAVETFLSKDFGDDKFAYTIALVNPMNNFPIVNKEYKTSTVPVNTTVNGKRLRLNLKSRTNVVDSRGMVSAFAPNVVHAADSGLLSLVEFNCNFDLALIHDSIGSHPNDAEAVVVAFSAAMHHVSETNPLQEMLDCLETGVVIPRTDTFKGEWELSKHCLV